MIANRTRAPEVLIREEAVNAHAFSTDIVFNPDLRIDRDEIVLTVRDQHL